MNDIQGILSTIESSLEVNLPYVKNKRLKSIKEEIEKEKEASLEVKDFFENQKIIELKLDYLRSLKNYTLRKNIILHIKPSKNLIIENKTEILEIRKQIAEIYYKANKQKRIWYDYLLKQELWSNELLESFLLSNNLNNSPYSFIDLNLEIIKITPILNSQQKRKIFKSF